MNIYIYICMYARVAVGWKVVGFRTYGLGFGTYQVTE